MPLREHALLTNAQLLCDGTIPLNVAVDEIVEQPTPLPDQLEQATPRGVVLGVDLEVFREFVDTLRENGDLNFGRPRVLFVFAELFDEVQLFFLRNHRSSLDIAMLKKNVNARMMAMPNTSRPCTMHG